MLRNEFWETIAKARDTGEVLTDWDDLYNLQTFYIGDEGREALIRVKPRDDGI
jgi:hypothetical protein